MQILNKGQRTIHYAEGKSMSPGKGANVDEKLANYLKKLFPGEVVSMEDVIDGFKESAGNEEVAPAETEVELPAENTPLEEFTDAQLFTLAKKYELNVPKRAKRETVIAKIITHEANLQKGAGNDED